MRRLTSGTYLYSPSDLITFLECEYVSWLDRYDKELPGMLPRDPESEEDRILRSSGEDHEREYFKRLIGEGTRICDLKGVRDSCEATRQAMTEGWDVIYQAYLAHGEFAGYADFLVRVPGQSVFGPYQYQVWDTKLARSMKPYFAIQLCCYAEMLEVLQGALPAEVGVVLGSGEQKRLKTLDYLFYYRALKRAFLKQQLEFDAAKPPDIPPHANFRHWTGYVEKLLEDRDDLSRVAGIRALQIKRLRAAGIRTVRDLAESTAERVHGMAPQTLDRLRQQARLQIESQGRERPVYRPLTPDPGQPRTGLAALPPFSEKDVYFDMEGYPLIEGGLEYLFGASYVEQGVPEFRDRWAHDRSQEKEAFEDFVHWAHGRWREDPAMHIYHYASYEKTTLRKLMGRFGVCEAELDDLLRNEVFVDLYMVVRQGLIIGEPSYSLKNVEHLYLGKRQGEVATASDSIVYYHRWRQEPDGTDWQQSPTLRLIRNYNREDCHSTFKLANWLRDVQSKQEITYVGKPLAEARELSEVTTARAALAQDMLAEAALFEDPERRRIHELLAWFLEFHRREQKPVWWALFERHAMTEQDLIDDPDCLGGLERTGRGEPVRRSLRYTYRFDPHQETKLREGKQCCFAHDLEMKVTIESIDLEGGTLTFNLGVGRPQPPERLSLIPYELVPPKVIVDAIERLVRRYRDVGQLPPAIADFLGRRPPRLKNRTGGLVVAPDAPVVDGTIEAIRSLDRSSVVVQGPPGCGKTYTAARVIAALVSDGRRIGVTSNSHRAIALLLQETGKACREQGIGFTGVNVDAQEEDGSELDGFETVARGADLFARPDLPQIVGGTAWVFSRPEAADRFDYLFVDEAGQVFVANLLGMAASTRNLVLLGDQRQLNQPVQGSHPGESGCSILEYLLGDTPVVPAELGIFLPGTWRMRPELCSFISDAVYEGQLQPVAVTTSREIAPDGTGTLRLSRTAGLLYVPVEHEGNLYESEEEADVIAGLVERLLKHGFRDNGCARLLSSSDILIVSPYNLQVRRLRRRLPDVRVGTVDKSQGQEAPVVIYSMTSSTGDACPRGLEFLFSPNRLNVALSRAQVLAILLGSPQLAHTKCSRLDQMRLVNLFCHAVEAGTLSLSAAAGIGPHSVEGVA
jgi:predicted RecB family nuclease